MRQQFSIYGERPLVKGRPRFRVVNGKVFTYTPPETVRWEKRVAWYARNNTPAIVLMEGRIAVTIDFTLRGTAKRGDLDNLAKSILDGLNGVAYKDDSQIYELHLAKKPGDPYRIDIVLETL